MPRLNSGLELFRRLDTLQLFRQAGTTQTTAAAAVTASQTTVNFTATTGFTANDAVIIAGQNGTELNAITALTPTTAVPLLYPALVANPSASLILRALASNLAHIGEEGIDLSGSAPLEAIRSALLGTPIGYIYGYGEITGSFNMLGMNGLNLQTWFGATESEIGTGATATPWGVSIGGTNIGSQGIQCLRATGTRADGATLIFDFCDIKLEPAGPAALRRDQRTTMPVNFRCTTLNYRQIGG